ncbi:MAG: hypothetical protein ACOY4R_30890 [Pseudomonadota bacterium]
MTPSRFHASIAFGSALIVGFFVAFVPPVPPASAESQAQRICREEGIDRWSPGYAYCLAEATRSLEQARPYLARKVARVAADSHDACERHGLEPQTKGFQSCVHKETYTRSLLIQADEEPVYGPDIADQ